MNRLEQAVERWVVEAATPLVEGATALVAAGKAYWGYDTVPGVFGLLLTGTNQALVVLYDRPAAFDWEADEVALEAAAVNR